MSYVYVIKQIFMTYPKKELFDYECQEVAEFARILSHPARIAILKYLASCKQCISGDISNEIPLSRTTVSQHLQELKKAGLIRGEIDGVKVNYCLDPKKLKEVRRLFESLFKDIKEQYECC